MQTIDSPTTGGPLRVVHFVDALGGGDRLWGKENVVVSLMQAQRDSGMIDSELVTFTPGLLSDTMRRSGFPVSYLNERKYLNPAKGICVLRSILQSGPPAVVHSHEYKANIAGRLARSMGVPMRRLVSTDHGWVDSTPQLEAYFALDRWTACFSDAVTVTDPAMLTRFPAMRPRSLTFIPNAVAELPPPSAAERTMARAHFNLPPDAVVIGSLGRLTKNKGILDILAAADHARDAGIIWAIAGSGAMAEAIEHAKLPNVRFVGYQVDNAMYLAALDVYLQASYFEGLSLSLLEAMRAGLPCIASRAGATEYALRNDREALLVDAGDINGLAAAASRLRAEPDLRATLGTAARARFDEAFTITRQHEAFLKMYRG